MQVLILSCNTGGGHNACAEAIQEALCERGHGCETVDALGFVSEKLSKFIAWGHVTMYRHIPGLFRAGYGFAEKHPALLHEDAAAYKLLTDGTKKLQEYLQNGGYDTVICTHVFSGLLLRQTMREYALQLKTAFVGTDYTCSPGTAGSELDHYFIPAESLTAEFAAQGVPEGKIVPGGIPVRRAFYDRQDQAEAKKRLGIDPDHAHLLMMCGSMGCGPMERLTKLLSGSLHETMELSVICGTNEKLRKELTQDYAMYPNIHIHGFVMDMGSMMDSADLYLTKPGGLSTTEAAAKGLPMVLIDAVAGCEEYNLNYFVSLGAAATAESPEELAAMCLKLLQSETDRKQMAKALDALPRQNAAQCICDTLEKG